MLGIRIAKVSIVREIVVRIIVVNVYDIVNADKLIVDRAAVETIQEVFGK